ncbi:MAG: bifunctional glutamate N-acetyltransferase/amino-acid acetyltransferase ArgJ [Myxococcota bacterium]
MISPLPIPTLPDAPLLDGGGWTSVPGARCGIARGPIKPTTRSPDVAVLLAPGVAAGVTTRSTAAAAPCRWCRDRLPGFVQAMVVNAGNANASTGPQGIADVLETARVAADALGCSPDEVLISSTGVIGVPLPMDRLLSAVQAAASAPSASGLDAARAIMTTDLVAKQAAVRIEGITVGGMAKGSGMIHPDMATMLAFVAADVRVAPDDLQALVADVAKRTFNAITVDGDMSTNDTLTVHAIGQGPAIAPGDAQWDAFARGVEVVCRTLSQAIARDGEGANHLLAVSVAGASDDATARRAARAIARSPLVKSALHGHDPNWGRIVGALGAVGVPGLERLDLDLAGVPVLRGGAPVGGWNESQASANMKEDTVQITARLSNGAGVGWAWGCDLSADYVRINADYRS